VLLRCRASSAHLSRVSGLLSGSQGQNIDCLICAIFAWQRNTARVLSRRLSCAEDTARISRHALPDNARLLEGVVSSETAMGNGLQMSISRGLGGNSLLAKPFTVSPEGDKSDNSCQVPDLLITQPYLSGPHRLSQRRAPPLGAAHRVRRDPPHWRQLPGPARVLLLLLYDSHA